MADNTRLNLNTTTGDLIRTVDRGASGKVQPVLLDVGGSAGEALIGDGSNALPISASSLPLPTGAATQASLASLVTAAGSPTETAPATDTASSGLNGRLQRIAQRLTSLLSLIPAALTGSGNFKVAVVEQTAGLPLQAGSVYVGGTLTTISRAAIAATASGSSVIVAAPSTGKKILILGFALVSDAAVSVKFVSTGDLCGPMPIAANGGVGAAVNPAGHMLGAVDTALSLNLSGAANVGGWLSYVQV